MIALLNSLNGWIFYFSFLKYIRPDSCWSGACCIIPIDGARGSCLTCCLSITFSRSLLIIPKLLNCYLMSSRSLASWLIPILTTDTELLWSTESGPCIVRSCKGDRLWSFENSFAFSAVRMFDYEKNGDGSCTSLLRSIKNWIVSICFLYRCIKLLF